MNSTFKLREFYKFINLTNTTRLISLKCLCGLLFIAFLYGGCAKVDIKKVPTPSQYVHWTDKQQHKADKIKGIRFYLPRPFINVFESFPIRTDIYIADGEISPDGKYVLIKSVKSESGMNNYIAGHLSGTHIPARKISKPSEEDVNNYLKLQSGAVEEAEKKAEDAKYIIPTGSVSSSKQDITPSTAPQPLQMTGINQRQVTNDNAAFAFQPLRGNFDIVYMPDFEEQYAISSLSGLGNAQFALNLGQGWSLQGFNSLTDNSELNKRMYDLIDTSINVAKTAASAYMGGIPLPELPPGSEKIFELQSGAESLADDKDSRPHTPVSLKIVVVHYAAKGLYPVIKPRELQERTVAATKGSGVFNLIMDLFRSVPFFMASSDYDPNAIRRAQQSIENETGKFTVPRYPYQYISFNTFRYMAIEVIKTDTKPFEILYDKTGTKGDAGDRQKADSNSSITGRKVPEATPTPTSDITKMSEEIGKHFNEKYFNVEPQSVEMRNEDGKIIVKVWHKGNAPTDYTTEERKKLSGEILEELKTKVDKKHIHEKPIELPPSIDQLNELKDSLNSEGILGNDSNNKWEIISFDVEASKNINVGTR